MMYDILKYYALSVVEEARYYRDDPIIAYWFIVGLILGCLEIFNIELELWRNEWDHIQR